MDFRKDKFPTDIITMDEKLNDVQPPKRTVKSYASRVFQESTIGMVASIVSSHSRARRCFKSLLFTLCVTGFLYQCTTFLLHVFEYPTVVDIDIQTPQSVNGPAYTFCSNNGIKRSFFCEMYPDRCYEPSKSFCSHFHSYCGTNNTLIPKKEYYELEDSMSHDEILKYGNNLDEFLNVNRSHLSEDVTGPYLRVKNVQEMSGAMICYSLHSVTHNHQEPMQRTRQRLKIGEALLDKLIFYVEENEMFIPGNRPGVLFSIHSPFDAVNPFVKGIFMKPGRTYRIYISMVTDSPVTREYKTVGKTGSFSNLRVSTLKPSTSFLRTGISVTMSMTQEVLLKDPFSTKCIDYEEIWEANNRTGPRIQEMCQHKCILDISIACFNCAIPIILYPTKERICNSEDKNKECPVEAYMKFIECWDECRDDCRITIYEPNVMERYEVDYKEDDDLTEFDHFITVELYLEHNEVVTMKYSPKYMHVEIFSAIGGFIGCWLGISLMDIIDVFASVFIVFNYAWKMSGRKLSQLFRSCV